MEIKHEKGIVTFRMRAGKDMVRNNMPIGIAKSIIAKAKTTKEENGELIVDDLYFFPVAAEKKNSKKAEETSADEKTEE